MTKALALIAVILFTALTMPALSADALNLDAINARLERHDSSVLSIIPSKDYKSGVAGVFKAYRLHVGNNGEIYYRDTAIPEKRIPKGYYISIFVSRIRTSGQYSDLAGFHAVWFKGEDDRDFRPFNGWARRISDHDSWLNFGSPIDTMDRP